MVHLILEMKVQKFHYLQGMVKVLTEDFRP